MVELASLSDFFDTSLHDQKSHLHRKIGRRHILPGLGLCKDFGHETLPLDTLGTAKVAVAGGPQETAPSRERWIAARVRGSGVE